MTSNNIEKKRSFILLDPENGEIVGEVKEDSIIVTKEKREAYKQVKRRAGREFVTMRTTKETIDTVLELENTKAGLLFVLGINIDWNGIVCENNYKTSIPLTVGDIRGISPIGRRKYFSIMKSLEEKGLIKSLLLSEVKNMGYNVTNFGGSSTFIKVNTKFVFRGTWKEFGINENTSQFRAYNGLFKGKPVNSISLKSYGVLFKIGCFLHKEYNVLVKNPDEELIENFEYITENELVELIGVSKKTLGGLLNELLAAGDCESILTIITGESINLKTNSGKRKKIRFIHVNSKYITRFIGVKEKPLDDLVKIGTP